MSNRAAGLIMIAKSEGTADLGDRGYNVLVGGTLFIGYADHPRIRVRLKGINIVSTAAGRYQILSKYYDYYKKLLKLSDFSPASQDAIALQMIKEQHAIADLDAGRIDDFIAKVCDIWASFPGKDNTYGQHKNKVDALKKFFTDAGGILATTGAPNVVAIA